MLISCHKHPSRISQLIVRFVMMAPLLSQGKIFYKHIYSKISKKKSLFKHFSKFHKQYRSHILCIPKYEQYPSTNVLSKRINGRGTHNFRTCAETNHAKIPPSLLWKTKIIIFDFSRTMARATVSLFACSLYVEHAKSDKVALCLGRSLDALLRS